MTEFDGEDEKPNFDEVNGVGIFVSDPEEQLSADVEETCREGVLLVLDRRSGSLHDGVGGGYNEIGCGFAVRFDLGDL